MKTPEQQAAQFVTEHWFDESGNLLTTDPHEIRNGAEATFLHGWRARSSIDSTDLYKWIDIKEKLPEKYTWCLWLYASGPEVNEYEGTLDDGTLLFHRDYYGQEPTHWMPLPIAAKAGETYD